MIGFLTQLVRPLLPYLAALALCGAGLRPMTG